MNKTINTLITYMGLLSFVYMLQMILEFSGLPKTVESIMRVLLVLSLYENLKISNLRRN